MFFRTGSTGSTSFFSREVSSLFWYIAWFFFSILRCYKDVYFNSFFVNTVFLPIECFPLTYNLKSSKSRINTLINCRFLLKRFHVYFNLFVLLYLVTPCLVELFSFGWSESQLKKWSRVLFTGLFVLFHTSSLSLCILLYCKYEK